MFRSILINTHIHDTNCSELKCQVIVNYDWQLRQHFVKSGDGVSACLRHLRVSIEACRHVLFTCTMYKVKLNLNTATMYVYVMSTRSNLIILYHRF